jgi:hypothetical protein
MHLPEARVLEFAPLEPKRDFSLLCYSLNSPLVSHFEMKPLGVLPYVSRDSRQLFLGKYRLCFGSMLEKPIYFNPKVDIVMFSNEYALELFSEAVNHLPSAETREDVAPVRKAAIRWTCLKDTHRGVPVPENIALDPKVKGSEYRWKLRILSERLDTLQQFAFCYLDRRIGDASRANMIRFVESMEAEMSERFTIARKNRNPSIAQSAGNCPSIIMLHCPTIRTSDIPDTDNWKMNTMDLGSRAWECSRFLENWSRSMLIREPRQPLRRF